MSARCSPPWPPRSPWPSPSENPPRHRLLPDPRPDRPALPRNVLRKSDIDRNDHAHHGTSGDAPEFSSTGSGNKARHAGPHHRVEPDVRLDALPNLPHGVFRQGRYLKVLLDIVTFGRGG